MRARLTSPPASRILGDVLRFTSRLSVLVLVLAFGLGRPALCAGWMPTPEARMACCVDGQACPMHQAEPGSAPTITQSEADSCCAASEGNDPTPSSSTFVLSSAVNDNPTPGPFTTSDVSTVRDVWRTLAPTRGAPVAKHLLLSAFLV